jgi:molybdopterin synthase catalytic subunit
MSTRILVQEADFDVGGELARLEALGGGGVASFTGVVRGGGQENGGLEALHLEAYPGMTQRALEGIAAQASARWSLIGLTLIHRHGTLAAGARIVLVATAARHRGAAIDACTFLIDSTKTRAPFWKQERFADGTARWIEPTAADVDAASLWDASAEHGRP